MTPDVGVASDLVASFITAACVPIDQLHSTGTLAEAEAIRAAHPGVARASIHTAAILGEDAAVRDFLARDPASATATGGPHGWDALTHLCFSRYLRLDPERSESFVRAATLLLDAGADPNTGWSETHYMPEPTWEPALYGAAGVAHHAGLTRLLLERGADPNQNEVVYHSPETHDNAAMKLVVETGRVTPENLALMLIRKHDWHDVDGARWLLEHGASPGVGWDRFRPLHHALDRDNALEMIALLLDHGADPLQTSGGMTAVARAARAGRSDVLERFRSRGVPIDLPGADGLIAACALGDGVRVRTLAAQSPERVREVVAAGGELLAKFAGTGNPAGVGLLLDLGVPVDARFARGDGYWGIPPWSLAIHVAAWRAQHAVVRMLIDRGSPADVPDANGNTPLALAIKAGVDSYWTERRTPESVAALLAAGASVRGISYPSGYAEVDALLAAHGANAR
jgi:ankyrin repeat protein